MTAVLLAAAQAGAMTPAALAGSGDAGAYFDSRARAGMHGSGATVTPPSAGPTARSGSAAGPAATARAQAALRRDLGRHGVLHVDPVTGTPRVLMKLDGALTSPAGGDRRAIATAFVRDNAAALGLAARDLRALDAAGRVDAPGGLTILRWRQVADGVPAFDNGIQVAVDRAGRVIALTGSPSAALRPDTAGPRLSATAALERLRLRVGRTGAAPAVTDGPRGHRAVTRFDTGDRARLTYFTTGPGEARLAWDLSYRQDPSAHWTAIVDARTGEVLFRANRVKRATATVVDYYRGAAGPGGDPHAVNLSLPGWLPAGAANLTGPNVRTFSDLDADDRPQPAEEITPSGSPPDFRFTFTNYNAELSEYECVPTTCGWNPGVPRSWQANRKQNAVQAFYLANQFHDHLESAPIGFDEDSGSFEAGDRLVQQTMDGADAEAGLPDPVHVNNANMSTPPDGESPTMQLYLFSPPHFSYLGDDAATVWHEYTHGLSNRLVTYDNGEGALNSPHAAAMGEAWSDWYAQDLLDRRGLLVDDPDVIGEVDLGLPSDPVRHLTRTEGLDCPVGPSSSDPAAGCPGGVATGTGGFTLADLGKVAGRPEVHADGEIWGQTLWDLRRELIELTGSIAEGSDAAQALITTGMRLSPDEPSMLDQRNAILAADTALTGGARHPLLWQVFAHRGMGFFAAAESGSDLAPAEDFGGPPPADAAAGTIAGRVTDADTGLPVPGARVAIGGVVTPTGGVLAAGTGADGRYAIAGAPEGTYGKLTVRPPAGYDPVDVPKVVVQGGRTATRDVALRRNWALLAGGASVTASDGSSGAPCGAHALADGDRTSGWSAVNPSSPALPGAPMPVATVTLPRVVDVTSIGIAPGSTCGNGASSALRGYRLETSTDGTTFRPYAEGEFSAADAGTLVQVAPSGGGAPGVTAVRLTLLSPQRTCDGCSGRDYIDVQELEVSGAVPNRLPSGTLTRDPAAVTAGATVTFTAAFEDADSAITGYDWDFDGDGTVDRSTSRPSTAHVYATPGSYTARVAAQDFRGGAGTAAELVEVSPAGGSPPAGARDPSPATPGPSTAAPAIRIGRTSRRGRIAVRVRCAVRCTVSGRVTVSKRTAERLRLRRRVIGSLRRTLGPDGVRTVRLPVAGRALRAVRRDGARRLRVNVWIRARYMDGRRATERRALRLRV